MLVTDEETGRPSLPAQEASAAAVTREQIDAWGAGDSADIVAAAMNVAAAGSWGAAAAVWCCALRQVQWVVSPIQHQLVGSAALQIPWMTLPTAHRTCACENCEFDLACRAEFNQVRSGRPPACLR